MNGVILSTTAINGDGEEEEIDSEEEDPELDSSPPPSPSVDRDIKKTESRGSMRNHIEKVCNNLCCA